MSGEPDEEQLVRRVARGDRAAFDLLYRRTSPWLALRVRRRCGGDAELAAEVLQETYVAVWRSAATFSGGGSAVGWIWTIAARRLIDAHRRRAREPRPSDAYVAGAAPAADEVVLRDELGDDLARALDDLSPELRGALRATVLDGLTTREASIALGVPEGTVKTRAHRARLALREALG